VVDEVEELALQTFLFPKDLFYELKHSSQNDYLLEEQFGLNNLIRYREVLGFITGYNKSQESHPFGEEDMIEFLNFHQRTALLSFTSTGENQGKTYKELLQIWKEQSIKTIYYN
jgi:esterase/lipase superfamily enzyme